MEDVDGEVIIRHESCESTLRVEVFPGEYYNPKANAYAEERFPQGISCTLPVEATLVLGEIT